MIIFVAAEIVYKIGARGSALYTGLACAPPPILMKD